jgi:hypothetical protein
MTDLIPILERASRVPLIRSIPKEDEKSLVEVLLATPEEFIFSTIVLPKPTSLTYIDYEVFKGVCQDPDFVRTLTQSVISLIDFKLAFYSSYIKQQQSLLKTSDTLSRNLKAKGVSPEEVERLCPGFSSINSSLILSQEEVHALVAKKKGISVDSTAKGLVQAVNEINMLRGRRNIKDFLAKRIYAFAKNYKIQTSSFKNITLYGPPGSGKTRIADTISKVFYSVGLTEKQYPKKVTKPDLVASFIGGTAEKTRGAFKESLGGVLVIDEAYNVADGKYGKEAITELVNLMDLFPPVSIIIAVGYKEKMLDKFMARNEGMHRRFPHQFTLAPYTPEEFSHILYDALVRVFPDDMKVTETDINLIFTLITSKLNDDADAFKNQAGDATEIAEEIVTKSYSLVGKEWGDLSLGEKRGLVEEVIEEVHRKKMDRGV